MDIKIAVIDGGVDSNHERLKDAKLSGKRFIFDDNKVSQTANYHDETGHGTAIAAIIHKHCPNAEIHCVKVFSDTMVIHEDVLYKALEYCIKSQYPIINLSLGVNIEPPPEQLVKLCKSAYENNIILICASNNSSQHPAYPASLPYVFGVGIGTNIKKGTEYGYTDESSIDFLAKGTIQRIAWKNGTYNVTQGTSYACAHFSGIVAKKISENKFESFEQLKQTLKRNANPQINPFIYYKSENNMDYIVSNNDLKHLGEKFEDASYIELKRHLNKTRH
jgi:subtilisin family serine protease